MIRLEKVSCVYPGADGPTLRDVSLDVPPGRCVLLQGSSGGGKSTLVRLLCGIIPGLHPAEVRGRVLVNGHEVAGSSPHETGRTLATVFQDCRSQFFMTHVVEELVFAARNFGRPEAEIQARLKRYAALMDVERLMERSVFRLSSGERQRTAIAAAAVHGPAAMVLDEPSANLDADGLERLAALLTELKSEGRAVLVVDHRSAYLAGVADERLRLEGGRLTDAAARPWSPDGSDAPDTPWTPPRVGDVLLELRGAELYRGRKPVLRGADLTLRAGELLAVRGGNGAGKTSLLRTLCGLSPLEAGEARLHGRRVSVRDLRRACALVMQDPDYQLFAGSVVEEIGLDCDGGSQERERIARLAGRFGLDGLLDRHPGVLSMGEKQRTLIAAALAADRAILLLDEPTSGMDPERMAGLASELRTWAESGGAAVLVTHDEDFIATTGLRRLELRHGLLHPADRAGKE